MFDFLPGETHNVIFPPRNYHIAGILSRRIPALYEFSWGEILHSGFLLGGNRTANGDVAVL